MYIDGYGYRRAEDCGAFGGNHIDVAVPTHSMALDMGVVYKDVYLAENLHTLIWNVNVGHIKVEVGKSSFDRLLLKN